MRKKEKKKRKRKKKKEKKKKRKKKKKKAKWTPSSQHFEMEQRAPAKEYTQKKKKKTKKTKKKKTTTKTKTTTPPPPHHTSLQHDERNTKRPRHNKRGNQPRRNETSEEFATLPTRATLQANKLSCSYQKTT
jgi:hypothetical protein